MESPEILGSSFRGNLSDQGSSVAEMIEEGRSHAEARPDVRLWTFPVSKSAAPGLHVD